MGTDLDAIMGSSVGQPMAQIFFNSFGQKGTLAIWAFVVLVQCVPPPAQSTSHALTTHTSQVHDGLQHGARGVAAELRLRP